MDFPIKTFITYKHWIDFSIHQTFTDIFFWCFSIVYFIFPESKYFNSINTTNYILNFMFNLLFLLYVLFTFQFINVSLVIITIMSKSLKINYIRFLIPFNKKIIKCSHIKNPLPYFDKNWIDFVCISMLSVIIFCTFLHYSF